MSERADARRRNQREASAKAPFLEAAAKLLKETARVTAKENLFPKRARWQFAYAIMDLANAYHSWAKYANGIEVRTRGLMIRRYEAQTVAMAWLKALNAEMSAAQDAMGINPDLLTNWAMLWDEAWTKTSAWRTSNLKRYEKQFGSLTADELREPTESPDPPGSALTAARTRGTRTTCATAPLREL